MLETLSVGLLAANLEPTAPGLPAWLEGLEARMREAQAAGARLLVLPELACAGWMHFAPPDLAPAGQPQWLAAVAEQAAAGFRELAARYGIALLAGSFPAFGAGPGPLPTNQAWLFMPDGRLFWQDKLALTPSEQGIFRPGTHVNVIPFDGLRLAIIVCLDIEFTALFARLGRLDLDLVLVPAKTQWLSGYARVFGCARARAIELQTVVCAVGAVGAVLGPQGGGGEIGGAAAYLPPDASLYPNGVAAELLPQGPGSGRPPLLICPALPVGACRRMRHGGAEAEVWPASWPADAITVADPAPAT